ncbi:internal capsid protein [Nostoc phage NMeng1]|nr:internal capsid protein [Nostoc phage NMeng1]
MAEPDAVDAAIAQGLERQGIRMPGQQSQATQGPEFLPGVVPAAPRLNTDMSPDPNRGQEEEWIASGGQWSRNGMLAGPVAFGGLVGRSFTDGGNTAVSIYKDLARLVQTGDEDPAWTSEAKMRWLEPRRNSIPGNQVFRFLQTRNPQEAQMLFDDQQAMLRSHRIAEHYGVGSQLVAGVLAGGIDIDTPLALMSGGITATAKAGILSSRAGRILSSGTSGAAVGAALGAVDYSVNPTSDLDDIITFGLFGGGFGLAGGALSRSSRQAADLHTRMIEEHGENLARGRRPGPSNNAPFTPVESIIPRDIPDDLTLRGATEADVSNPVRAEGSPGLAVEKPTGPMVFNLDELDAAEAGAIRGGSTAGAAQVNYRSATEGVDNARFRAVIEKADEWAKRDGRILDELYDWGAIPRSKDSALGDAGYNIGLRSAELISKTAAAIGLGTDWHKLMRTESKVGRWLGYELLESPAGVARNATSASVLREVFRREFVQEMSGYLEAVKEWVPANHGTSWASELFETNKYRKATENFNEAVISDLMARRFGGARTQDPLIRKAADSVDRMFAKEIEIGKGRPGETGIAAFKDLESKSGYIPQWWSGRKFRDLVNAAADAGGDAERNKMKQSIINFIDGQYKVLHPTLNAKDRRIVASAVFDRAMTKDTGTSMNMLGLLSGDESDAFRAALARNGLDQQAIDRLERSLRGSREEAMRPGFTKSRIDIDFRATQGNLRMMDLLETDLFSIMNQRANKTAGLAALSRKGITSLEDWELVTGAALAEDRAFWSRYSRDSGNAPGTDALTRAQTTASDLINEPRALKKEDFDNIWQYFNGGYIGTASDSQNVARIIKLTRLSLLNQLGLTQVAETGTIAGAVGLKHFFRHTGEEISTYLGKGTPLRTELEHLAFFLPSENMFRMDMIQDFSKMTASGELVAKLDRALDTGLHMQGKLNGFFAVRDIQQRIAVTSATSRIFEAIKMNNLEQFSDVRLKDMGVDLDAISKYVDNGTVEFKDGRLYKLHADRWDPMDLEKYKAAMVRVTNQLVQEAMIGESNSLFHVNGLARLFFQFKSFPLLAIDKQFGRNLRIADEHTMNIFWMGMLTAGMAYYIRQTINNRPDNLEWENIAKGALNYSNMAGWIPMWYDPIATMLGQEDYKIEQFGGRQSGLLSLPAAYSVLNRVPMIPQAAVKIGLSPTGLTEYTTKDVSALQAIPLIGNIYGINGALNAIKPKGNRDISKLLPGGSDEATSVSDPVPMEPPANPLEALASLARN